MDALVESTAWFRGAAERYIVPRITHAIVNAAVARRAIGAILERTENRQKSKKRGA